MIGSVRTLSCSCILAVVVAGAGCGGNAASPTAPTASSAAPSAPTSPTLIAVAGRVVDPLGRGISHATVRMTEGPLAGATSSTDADGRFQFVGGIPEGQTIGVDVFRDGYASFAGRVRARSDLGFRLTPMTLVDLEGTYAVTFTAADSCSQIPTELRTRTYVATGSPERSDRTTFTLKLSGASFQPAYDTFWATVAEDAVSLSVYSWDAFRWWLEDYPIIERVGEGRLVAMKGTARADAVASNASAITALFTGTYSYCTAITEPSFPNFPTTCSAPVECQSDRHHLRLARR